MHAIHQELLPLLSLRIRVCACSKAVVCFPTAYRCGFHVIEGDFAAVSTGRLALSEAAVVHPSSVPFQPPSTHALVVSPMDGRQSTIPAPPSRLPADRYSAGRSIVLSDCAACGPFLSDRETEPDRSMLRSSVRNSAEPTSPAHPEVGLSLRMASMSLGQSSSNASMSIPTPATQWPTGHAALPFALTEIKAIQPGSYQGSRASLQQEDGSSAAPLSPQHYPPQPPQTPPPAQPNQSPYSPMRASSISESALQVRCLIGRPAVIQPCRVQLAFGCL